MRFHHPSLAAYVTDDNDHLTYTVPRPEDIESWIDKTLTVADHAADSAEVIPTLEPNPYGTLVYIPRSNELLGHTAHWRSDGIGVAMLMDRLLQLLVEPNLTDPITLPWGEEPRRLAPAVEDAANMPLHPDESQVSLSNRLVGTFALVGGAVGIPHFGSETSPPQGTFSATETLTDSMTNAVVDACKSQGLSVTSAVHASVAAANWKLAVQERKLEHYTSTVRFSLRPYLPEPYSGPAYPSGLYTTGWMDKVDPAQTWLEYARHYNEVYQKGLSREYINAHRAYASGLGNMLQNLPADLPIQSDVDISSIGVAEDLIKRSYGSEKLTLEVVSMSVGVEILTRQAVCFVWTFRDQLNLHVVYNEAYHEKDQMISFVAAVKVALLEGLEIKGS
jgi:hypothetical protein